MNVLTSTIAMAGLFLSQTVATAAQTKIDFIELVKTPAVSGYEQKLSAVIQQRLAEFSPKTDNVGNVYVTIGSGPPYRLIATTIDEPGYVVSEITGDGYLRVQRLPQASPNPVFDTLQFAQPVWVMTQNGGEVRGVFVGLSVHLQPGRTNAPKMNSVEELYVDIGATSAAEVRAAGVDLLDPIVAARMANRIGYTELAGAAVGDRFGAKALLHVLSRLDPQKVKGTLSVAFVTQQWTGGRGLNRLLTELHPDEMIYVGRITVSSKAAEEMATLKQPGAGVLLGLSGESTGQSGLPSELLKIATASNIKIATTAAALPRMAGYVKGAAFPQRFVQVGVATKWPATPAEVIDENDVKSLEDLLDRFAGAEKQDHGPGVGFAVDGWEKMTIIAPLVRAYGASGHEAAVREEVKKQLPDWARKKAMTDTAGNLVLHWGDGKRDERTARLAFVAHLDEIGYEVKKIEEDGRLQVEVLGGGFTQYFLGHPVLVHKKNGERLTGVLELPEGWDKSGFEWPSGPNTLDEPAHVYVGTKSREETAKFGIQAGDYVTIPKEYRPLGGTRANARSFDDRVGCAALIEGVRRLGPELPGRDVTFVWSTEEEVGLKGAAAFAEQAAKENRVPDFVFAIDTFVSSDSPLESKRFADAELGKGFVVRAVDNSNITPLAYVHRVVALAKENGIPVQYGITGGGNDGSVFLRYGSVDIPLGWPLRYSHSPAEVIDTRDLDALGKIVEALARTW